MGWSARWFLALALLCQSSQVFAQIYNTGVNASNQVSGAPNSTELHWSLQSFPDPNPANPPLGPSHTVIENPLAGSVTSTTAQWIAPPASNGDANTFLPLGTYLYQTKFRLPKYVDPPSVVLTGSFAAGGAGSLNPFTLDHTNASFAAGNNILTATVQNTSGHADAIVDQIHLTYNVTDPFITNLDDVYGFDFPLSFGSAFGSPLLSSGIGEPFDFTVTAGNNPTSFSAAGLPPNLVINSATGEITGTPVFAGFFSGLVTTQNQFAPDTGYLPLLIPSWSASSATIIPGAFGNGIYVSVNGNNSSTSLDAFNWTQHTVDGSASPGLDCVTFGKGLFVAGGSSGKIYTSPDGINWTNQTGSSSVPNFLAIAFGNNTFVATNFSGIYSSSDLVTWTIFASGRFTGVAYGNGIFLAVGRDGAQSSIDGTSWSPISTPLLDGIVFGANSFVALKQSRAGGVHDGYVVYSNDASTWRSTETGNGSPGTLGFGNNTFFENNKFVANSMRTHSSAFPTPSTIDFTSPKYTLLENAGSVAITLTRSGDLGSPATISCSTEIPVADSVFARPVLEAFYSAHLASEGTDYQRTSQTLVFQPGETTKTVSIPILNNSSSADGRRDFEVLLTGASEGVAMGSRACVTILDDDKSLQIVGEDDLQNTFNADHTVDFSANLTVANSAPSSTGSVRVKLVAKAGYTFFPPGFDPLPPLPQDLVLGTFNLPTSLSGASNATVAVAGTVPAPQNIGGGYVYWWVYAQLEEQAGSSWFATSGEWPFLYSSISVLSNKVGGGDACFTCIYNGGGRSSIAPCDCSDTGGATNPGDGGSLPLLPPPPKLSALAVNGPTQVNKSSGTQYNAAGTLSDGTPVSPSTVTWSASMFSISSTGVFTAGSVKTDTPVTLTASTTIAGITQSGSLTVTVRKNKIKVPKPTVATPTITPNGGTFSQSVQVTLADATPGATIRFTTDGSTPTKKSPVYSAPFTLASNATVHALALKTGATNSGLASASFTITP